MNSDVKMAAAGLFPRLRKWRRMIHQYPELGFEEKHTSALVSKVLVQLGWEVKTAVARTGVVGLLKGGHPGPTFGLRADLDGLPIEEQNRCTYRSRRKGIMHACGHDGNTAMVLGAAALLSQYKEQLHGNVKVIFQPCEEVPPGGAQAMIRAGVLKKPEVKMIIAGHVDTGLPAGMIGVKSGPVMAAADAFTLTVWGRGGHGAMPHKSVDAIAIAGEIIANIQHIVSREVDPLEPAVISLGSIEGGSAFNVIAGQVVIRGTIRTLNDRLRRQLPKSIERLAGRIAGAHRGKAQLSLELGHPALVNHVKTTELLKQSAIAVLGRKQVRLFKHPLMSGEDFTYYAREIPACFFNVGVGGASINHQYPWHHPKFDFDEKGLVAGTAVLVQTVLDHLK